MIASKLKDSYRAGYPVIQEYVAFMNATFKYYRDTRAALFEGLPTKLHQSDLVNFVNNSLKERLFDPVFCETIQESLRSLRRLSIRLEDLRASEEQSPVFVHHLAELVRLAEAVENLYQQHWEYFRYQDHVAEEEVVSFVLAIGNIERGWERYLAKHAATGELVEALSGIALPDEHSVVSVSYEQENISNFTVERLNSLTNYLAAIYSFVCAVSNVDAEQSPLGILHIEVGKPVQVQLALPKNLEAAYRKMLKHLFLKDMVKRETLLKFVFEEIQKEFSQGKTLSTQVLNGFQKKLAVFLKELPEEGIFRLSEYSFPEDNIRVLQSFTSSLEEKKINYEPLLKAMQAAKPTPKPIAAKVTQDSTPLHHPSGTSTHGNIDKKEKEESGSEKRHIQILTDSR